MRVLGVRIAWHVKRSTSSTVKRSTAARAGDEQVGMRAAGSEPGRRRASRDTPANQVHAVTVRGDARASNSVVVLTTPTDPMVFRRSTRDVKARSAAKQNMKRWSLSLYLHIRIFYTGLNVFT